jgi:hypothetical protein
MTGDHGLSQYLDFQGEKDWTPPLSLRGESPDDAGNPPDQQRDSLIGDASRCSGPVSGV